MALSGCLILAWRFGPDLLAIMQDRAAVQALVTRAGWLGPILLIALNALQIVIAPIPGYAMQLAAGFLFGPFWGGVWGSLGVLAGSTLAMALTRRFGRPMAERMVGAGRLKRWEGTVHGESLFVWAILLLAPTGDLPYFLAGLSHIGYGRIALLTMITRVPTTFVVAALGAGVVLLPWWQLALLLSLLMVLFVVLHRYQTRLQGWLDRQTRRLL